MSNIQFISHESFPEDPYNTEIVYLCIEGKYRVAYVRKNAKNGGKYWGVMSMGLTKDGIKIYRDAFMQDSRFLEEDIKDFLDKRSWEQGRSALSCPINDSELPF